MSCVVILFVRKPNIKNNETHTETDESGGLLWFA